MLLLLLLAELWGRKRPAIFGPIGAAFLTRPPLAFVGPVFALWYLWPAFRERGLTLAQRVRVLPWRDWGWLALVRARVRVLPALQRHPVRLADGVRLRARSAPRMVALRDQGCSRSPMSG